MLGAINQLSVWDDGKILIVDAFLENDVIHVELISTTFHQPDLLDIKLNTGDTVSVDSYEIESTGTYYFYGEISVNDKIPDGAKITSIRFIDAQSKSNDYRLSVARNSGW